MIFHFKLFPRKTNGSFFWAIFPILGQNRIFLEILFLPVFLNSDKISLSNLKKKTKKLMSAFQATLISVPLKPIVHNGDN